MESVQEKAQRLVRGGKVVELKMATVWEVQGDTGKYLVDCLNGNTDDSLRCNCIRGIHRESARYCHMAVGDWCSHILAVRLIAEQKLAAVTTNKHWCATRPKKPVVITQAPGPALMVERSFMLSEDDDDE